MALLPNPLHDPDPCVRTLAYIHGKVTMYKRERAADLLRDVIRWARNGLSQAGHDADVEPNHVVSEGAD